MIEFFTMMPDRFPLHEIDDIFTDVGGVVREPLQLSSDQYQINGFNY